MSSWYCGSIRSTCTVPPHRHSRDDNGACSSSSTRCGTDRKLRSPYSLPLLRPGVLGSAFGSPLENGAAWRGTARRAFSSSRSNRSMRFLSRWFLNRACSTCRCSWRFSSSTCLSRSGSLCGGRGACMCKGRIRQRRGNVQLFLAGLSRSYGFALRPDRKSLLTNDFTPVDNYKISRLKINRVSRNLGNLRKIAHGDCLHQRTGRLVDGSPVLDGAAHFDIQGLTMSRNKAQPEADRPNTVANRPDSKVVEGKFVIAKTSLRGCFYPGDGVLPGEDAEVFAQFSETVYRSEEHTSELQ